MSTSSRPTADPPSATERRRTAHRTRVGEAARSHFAYEAASFAAIEALGSVDELYRRELVSYREDLSNPPRS